MAQSRPGAEKHEIREEDSWMVLLQRAMGWSYKGPGKVDKNLIFSISSGGPWKTSEQERGKEQQHVVNNWDRDRKEAGVSVCVEGSSL